MTKMSLDDKLAADRFLADEHNAHITINKDYENEAQIARLIMACPAGLYRVEGSRLSFNHEGCLECGTCRVLSKGQIVTKWGHPLGGKGVDYRQG